MLTESCDDGLTKIPPALTNTRNGNSASLGNLVDILVLTKSVTGVLDSKNFLNIISASGGTGCPVVGML